MKRLDQLIGLPAVLHASGKRSGLVAGVSLDETGLKVSGLIIEGHGVVPRKRHLPLSQVYLVGDVSAIVESRGKNMVQKPNILEAGRRVLSTDGGCVGMLTNALIDIETGDIAALEVSSSWWDDWANGRTWIRHFQAGQPGGVIVSLTPDEIRPS